MSAVAVKKIIGPQPTPDDLVPIKEAAEAVGRSLVTIATLVTMGKLRHWVDESAPARQGRRLVSLGDVVRYAVEVDERRKVRPGAGREVQ